MPQKELPSLQSNSAYKRESVLTRVQPLVERAKKDPLEVIELVTEFVEKVSTKEAWAVLTSLRKSLMAQKIPVSSLFYEILQELEAECKTAAQQHKSLEHEERKREKVEQKEDIDLLSKLLRQEALAHSQNFPTTQQVLTSFAAIDGDRRTYNLLLKLREEFTGKNEMEENIRSFLDAQRDLYEAKLTSENDILFLVEKGQRVHAPSHYSREEIADRVRLIMDQVLVIAPVARKRRFLRSYLAHLERMSTPKETILEAISALIADYKRYRDALDKEAQHERLKKSLAKKLKMIEETYEQLNSRRND